MKFPLTKQLAESTADQGLKSELDQLLKMAADATTTIRTLTDEFTKIARTKNITLYYNNEYGVDGDIFIWLPNAVVTETLPPTGEWKPVDTDNGTSERTMQESAVKMSLSQAIVKFTEMLRNGEFDKKETYRIIFLTETKNGNPIELYCGRYSGGELNLCVDVVHPDGVWRDAGNAWFGSNNKLFTKTGSYPVFVSFSLCSIPFFQPPSILPISCNSVDNSAKWIFCISLPSHAIVTNNFIVSNFFMVWIISDNFSPLGA